MLIGSLLNLALPQATQSGLYFNLFLAMSCVYVIVSMATCQVLDGREFEFRQGP